MEKQLWRLLASILSLYLLSNIFLFIEADGITSIIIFSIVLWVINLLLRPLLLLIVLPFNIITLGFFSLIVNTWIVILADKFIKGITIPNFWIAFLLAVLIKAFNSVFKGFRDNKKSSIYKS